jgi:hypothetical protein
MCLLSVQYRDFTLFYLFTPACAECFLSVKCCDFTPCHHVMCLLSMQYRVFTLFFLRNTVQTQALTYTHPYERTPYPYEHLRKTELADRVLRLTKSPRAPCYRRERRLPLKEYSAFIRHRCQTWGLNSGGLASSPFLLPC